MSRICKLIVCIALLLQGAFVAYADPIIRFIQNKNQWPSSVQFAAQVSGGQVFLQPGGFHFQFFNQRQLAKYHDERHHPGESNFVVDRMVDGVSASILFEGASTQATVKPFKKLATYYNYFRKEEPQQWSTRVPSYEGVEYESLYPGVDLKIYSQDEALKYDLIVAPQADAGLIQIRYEGVDNLILSNGNIQVKAGFTGWTEQEPVAYQLINGKRVSVACTYALLDGKVSFHFPEGYDVCHELVIDPLLIFSTYSGSAADNWGSTATPGENGTLYSAGVTNHFTIVNNQSVFSGTFPVSAGAFQTSYGGLFDVGILKYDSTGHSLLYASYLGGSQSESPHSMVVNSKGELIVLGTTSSSDFPTSPGAYDRSFNGGTSEGNVITYAEGSDIFVARLSADGSQLLASTYLGGIANDGLNPTTSQLTANYGDQLRGDVIADAQGDIYISSVTSSADFPVADGFPSLYKGGITDAIVVKLSSDLTALRWSHFLGGNGADASHSIKISPTGDVYLAGGTNSSNFTTTAGSYQPTSKGGVDGWIAKLREDGNGLEKSTLTGTAGFDQVYFIDLNNAGEVFAYGQTNGSFPTTPGVYKNSNSGQFVQKFSGDLSVLLFSTVFGSGRGVPDISPTAFLVNDCNNIYMSGWGGSLNHDLGFWNSDTRDLPITPDAVQPTTSGADFYFIVLTDDATEFLYGTYLGGGQSATHVDGGTSRFDKSGIVYHAVCSGCRYSNTTGGPSSDFPTTPGAWSSSNNSKNCNNAAFKLDLSSLRARIQTNTAALNNPGVRDVCIPDEIVFQNRSTGGQVYQWDLGDGTLISKSDTTRIAHIYENPGKYAVKLIAIDAGTCIGRDSTTVVIDVSKLVTEVSEDMTICFGSSVRLSASGGAIYEWMAEGFMSTEPNPLVSPDDTTRYFVTTTSNKGCVEKDTVDISVVPGIDLDFSFDKVYDCISRPYLKVRNLTEGKEDETFSFDWGDGTQSNQAEDQHNYSQDAVYTVKLMGKKEFCVYEKQEQVPIFSISVPNAITPADETDPASKNDTFQITFGSPPLVDPNQVVGLSIYNRWGNLVYSSDNYKGDWRGEGLENGIYYYELNIEGETSCKSWIHVIK